MKTEQNDIQDFPGNSALPGDGIFPRFIAPMSEVPDTLPIELVPYRHTLPEPYDDPSVDFSEWEVIFCNDLKLTDTKDGLRAQKVNENITEITNAILHRFEFASVSGQMAVYDSPCWRILSREAAARFIKETVCDLFPGEAKFLSSKQHMEIMAQLLHDSKTRLYQEFPAPDYHYLCCRDHMYDWCSDECLSHNSSYLRFSYLNFNAKDIGYCDGTYWEKFLNDLSAGSEALRLRILEMIGVIISGYPSKSFFLLEGESNTGKSQLTNFLRDILGKSACAALNGISQLGDKWTPGSLFGKLLCLCGDVPKTPLDSKTIANIKQLTGDDLILGEIKYQNPFFFENTAKLLFSSNHPLQVPNEYQDQAFLNRLVLIPCYNPVPRSEQIPQLHVHLSHEAGYIIALAMDALKELIARNGEFTPLPEELEDKMIQAPDEEQMVIDFICDDCIREEGVECPVSAVFQAFQVRKPRSQMTPETFSKCVYNLFPEVKRGRTKLTRKFCGLCLKDFSSPQS